ncbi:MAG: hypothetical protein AB2692_20665 [Candidatus Thiodiazotropha sp.]
MAGQLDLLGHAGLKLNPDKSRSEPRLWVRCLVIWSEPGVILRKISLRPGLNIIWSPDPAEQTGTREGISSLGHGSGKTLFCRLLRYCLGEDRFATDEQRYRITEAFPNGRVGAEVIVDGVRWAVVRPIGSGRQHFAIRDADLDQVVAGEFAATGMEPFLKAVESNVLTDDVVALIPGDHPQHAWLVALAWLSRDQECRFDKVLDWRSSDSDSDSPARGLSATKLLDAVRALTGAIVHDEYALRAEIGEMETQQKEVVHEDVQRGLEADRLYAELITALGLNVDDIPPGRLAMEALRSAAKANLARIAAVDPTVDVTDLESLRSQADKARQQVEALEKKLAQIEARIPEIESLIRRIKGEMPGATAAMDRSANPLCPVCEVPIDRTLAEGCKLSHKIPDLNAARQRVEQVKRDVEQESERLQKNKDAKQRLENELDPARKHADTLRRQLKAAERARNVREESWFNARRLVGDVDRLDRLLLEQEHMQARADTLESNIEAKRNHAGALRDEQADVFIRLSQYFDALIRELVGPKAAGKVVLDGNGLKLSVELGGERSTAAIDSLKVIAFDLAVMCMSIEGGVHVPALLIHDSPREADLGLSVYHRLFYLACSLEREESPQFQYLVTTTTRPPDELIIEPWLRETLGGAAEARLMRRDL